ncbi:hypothetical protein F4821DRAFT_254928 [Hypoxylon rubiginosum]|uniref:Uncharacterized protein n=1 Tax=Hypoxylon rubiginosum TaxID=110542 RepID=A0ACC0DGS2_9PEZI|nr:hypothetical protein F4821DRAFT_254928 [Hypoxylon rubiginosum]
MEFPQGYVLESATSEDIPTLTDFLVKSKRHLVFNRFLYKNWPNEEQLYANCKATVSNGIYYPEMNSLKVVNTTTNKTVAYLLVARVVKPEYLTPADARNEKRRERRDAQERNKRAGVINFAVVDTMLEAIRRLGNPEGDHLEIKHIYVEPSSRKLGIGTALLRECLDRAVWEGLRLTVNAEPNHHEWFLRRGFIDVVVSDVDLRQFAPEHSGYGQFRISKMILPRNGLQ